MITVVGLGPAGAEYISASAKRAIERCDRRFLRTSKHPAAASVAGAVGFDDIYESEATLEDVYREIVRRLLAEARSGDVVYAVPGSPVVAERTVVLLRQSDAEVTVIPAMSFLDLAWARLHVDPIEHGVRLVDGHRFAVEASGANGPVLVAQCDSRQVLSDIKLSCDDGAPVTVLQRLGLEDESVFEVAWDDIDRSFDPDHLTSLWIPRVRVSMPAAMAELAETTRLLRDQCPWDIKQTHQTLTRYLIEEAYEVVEAVIALDQDGGYDRLEDELGDVLFQVYFHSRIAEQAGMFTLGDVAARVNEKLVRRHPHVFGDVRADNAEQVMANWEEIKKKEKGVDSVMDGVTGNLPSTLYAAKVQRKAAAAGFDWTSVDEVYPKVEEELAEVRAQPSAEELGDLLFAVVNVARHLDIDPEAALRSATGKFRNRFQAVEAIAAARGIDLTSTDIAGLDALWDEVKAAE